MSHAKPFSVATVPPPLGFEQLCAAGVGFAIDSPAYRVGSNASKAVIEDGLTVIPTQMSPCLTK